MKKKLLTFAVLAAALCGLLTGCMTKQVELRMEYDGIMKPLYTAPYSDEKKDAFLSRFSGGADAVYGFVYGYTGNVYNSLIAGEPVAGLSSSEKDSDGNAVPVPEGYRISGTPTVTLSTLSFKVDGSTADALILLTVSAAAADSEGNKLTDSEGNAITYNALIPFSDGTTPYTLRMYQISADADAVPVYSLTLSFTEASSGWNITGITENAAPFET